MKIFGIKGQQGGDGTKSKKNPQKIRFCSDNGRGFVVSHDVELIDDDEEDAKKRTYLQTPKEHFLFENKDFSPAVTMEEDLLTAVTDKELPGAIVAPLPSLSNR